MKYKITTLVLCFLLSIGLHAQILDKSWRNFTNSRTEEWYSTNEAKDVAENVLLYQRNIGGWPKNTPMHLPLSAEEKKKLLKEKKNPDGATTDNNATIMEMEFLSNVYAKIPDARYKKSFLLGLNYLLKAQYPNGGWPQFFPSDSSKYYSQITYNDNSMVNIMELLQNVVNDKYSIKADAKTKAKSKSAFDKGIDCILKTQYKQNGVLTAWCAQHDKHTLLPCKARAYELPSLSGKESAGIVLLLMSLDNPSKEVINSVNHAVAWFEKTKITGWRVESYVTADSSIKEKRMVADSTAGATWARFMNLEDNVPFFCDRDGIKRASMMDIGRERRVGYAWYAEDARKVLKNYPKWEKKWNIN